MFRRGVLENYVSRMSSWKISTHWNTRARKWHYLCYGTADDLNPALPIIGHTA